MIDRNFYFQLHENAKAFPYVCRKGAMTNLVAWMRGIRPCKPREFSSLSLTPSPLSFLFSLLEQTTEVSPVSLGGLIW